MAQRIRARAIRRAGELLKMIEPQPGKRTDVEPCGGAPTRLEVAKAAELGNGFLAAFGLCITSAVLHRC